MLTRATTTSRKLDYNDETSVSESDEYDLEKESEVEGSEEDEDDGDDNVYADASKHLVETWSYLAPPAFYAIEMGCLKPKVGLRTIMEDTPDHLPDVDLFNIEDVIDGPLEVLPLQGKKWDVPKYERIAAHFQVVSEMDRTELKNSQ